MFEQRKRPAFLEKRFRRIAIRRVERAAGFTFLHVQRERALSSSALLGLRAIPLAGKKVIQRSEQERTEATPVPLQA